MKDYEFDREMNEPAENGNIRESADEMRPNTEPAAFSAEDRIEPAAFDTPRADDAREARAASEEIPSYRYDPHAERPAYETPIRQRRPDPRDAAAGYNAPQRAYEPVNDPAVRESAERRAASERYGDTYPYGVSRYQGSTYNAYSARPRTPETGISYAPSEETRGRRKKEKTSKPVSLRAVAVICCVCVILAGLAGFGGTLLANKLTSGSGTEQSSEQVRQANASPSVSDPLVIYKSTDDTATPATVSSTGGDMTYSQVSALVKDSVVEIYTEFTVRSTYFGQYTTQAGGSGVILSEDGNILTNAHVVTNEDTGAVADNITVRLTNGDEYEATVVSYDTEEDIAVIKIDKTGLTPARCGDSDKLVVGEEILVVGNPLGELGGSVSNGIVSATEREIVIQGVTMHLIQTNAAINPGNSGGGMFNLKGELVGIVNAKSGGTMIEGLGFAIPINQALNVIEQLVTYGYVRGKPMIGVTFEDVSRSSYYFYYNVKPGVYVSSLVEGMNDKVLEVGDRVIAVNGTEVSESSEIKTMVQAAAIGDKLTFQLYRDNKLMEVEVTVFERTSNTYTQAQNPITFDEDEGDANGDEGSYDLWGDGSMIPEWLEDFFRGR